MAGEDTRLEVEIDAKVGGVQQTRDLATAVEAVQDSLRSLVASGQKALSTFAKMEQGLAGVSAQAKVAKSAIAEAAAASAAASKTAAISPVAGSFKASTAQSASGGSLSGELTTNQAIANSIGVVTKQQREAAEATAAARAQVEKMNAALAAEAARYTKVAEASLAHNKAQTTSRAMTPATPVGYAGFQQAGLYQKYLNEQVDAANAKYKQAVESLGTYRDRLANTRYALYGLSQTMAVVGAVMLASNIAIVKQASDFQTYNASIQRTSQTSGKELQNLEDQFMSLGQSIPVAFKDLADIEKLGGQLGIDADQLTAFTKTTAEFAATTGISADTSATALGRLNELLPDVQGNFEGLGSSILKVGINSVATEDQIVQISSQIASAGAQAGLTADQVIGLSGSFASLGVAPEAARGTIIRVFGLISKAISKGGDDLSNFADIAGESSTQFASSWGSPQFINTFLDLLSGLNDKGPKAQNALSSLGITAARDQNNLLKLSQNIGLVNSSLDDAKTGYDNASTLQDQFGKIASTVASKLQVLMNTLKAFFATLGSGGLQFIGGIIDVLNGLFKSLTQFAKLPAVQAVAGFVGAFTALGGVALLVTAGIGRLTAAVLAGRPVWALLSQTVSVFKANLAATQAQAAATGVEMSTLKASAIAAGVALKGALISSAVGIGLVVLISTITTAVTGLQQAYKSSADSARDYFGDLSSLTDALQKDTAEAAKTSAAHKTVKGTIEETTKTTADWVFGLEDATGAQVNASDSTEETTKSIRSQTFAIGENTKEWLANQIANDKNVQEIFKNRSAYEKGGLNVTGFLTALATNDTAKAKQIYDQFYNGTAPQLKGLNGYQIAIAQSGLDVGKVTDIFKSYSGAVGVAASNTKLLQEISSATGVSMADLTSATEGAASSQQDMSDAVQAAFAPLNAVTSFTNAFYQLSDGIIQSGNSFAFLSEAGAGNVANLESAITTAISAADTLGVSTTEAVAAVFLELQKQGVDTANLLAAVASIPGVNTKAFGQYVSGTKQLSANGQNLANVLDNVYKSAQASQKSVGGVGKSAQSAAQKVYTLVNYASDLGGVFSRSFDLRFGGTQALDAISSGWQDIADKAAQAQQKMADANATLQKLAADKQIDEYFLSVANAYGDTKRAVEIQADLAGNASDTANAQKDLSDAAADADTNLQGNSKAAIANRKALTDLVQNYEDYIKQLASSGADQATLTATTQRLKQEFINQATQLGYNTNDVQSYASAFDDLTYAIQNVPRNITVNADTNPARQAVNEFIAGVNASRATVGVGDSSGGYGGGYAAGAAYGAGWVDGTSAYRRLVTTYDGSIPGGKVYQYYGPSGPESPKFFKTGGYTGNVSSSAIAGSVHGKEFVVDADNTARLGLPFLNALNKGLTPATPVPSAAAAATSSNGMIITQWSAQDRALLMEIASRPVVVSPAQIANATNAANFNTSTRGA